MWYSSFWPEWSINPLNLKISVLDVVPRDLELRRGRSSNGGTGTSNDSAQSCWWTESNRREILRRPTSSNFNLEFDPKLRKLKNLAFPLFSYFYPFFSDLPLYDQLHCLLWICFGFLLISFETENWTGFPSSPSNEDIFKLGYFHATTTFCIEAAQCDNHKLK